MLLGTEQHEYNMQQESFGGACRNVPKWMWLEPSINKRDMMGRSSQGEGPGLAAHSENLLERQLLGPRRRPTEPGMPGVRMGSILYLHKPPGDSGAPGSWEPCAGRESAEGGLESRASQWAARPPARWGPNLTKLRPASHVTENRNFTFFSPLYR